jgi:hypothetical protein
MRHQPRDGEIIKTIYQTGGLVSFRQLKALYWPHASKRAALKRLSILIKHGYLARPCIDDWRTKPIPEAIYWLGWQGILWIAAQQGIVVEKPRNSGENQLRLLHRQLRERGILWLREPRWSQIAHDLHVVDFRLILETSVKVIPNLSLIDWVREYDFRSVRHKTSYTTTSKDKIVIQNVREVVPDGMALLTDEVRAAKNKPHRMALLLEIDMGTHSVIGRFGLQKAAPYAAFIKSPEYKAWFGFNGGTWLIVTTGERRMEHLMEQTRVVAGEDAANFNFTKFSDLSGNILTAPIWWQPGGKSPRALVS